MTTPRNGLRSPESDQNPPQAHWDQLDLKLGAGRICGRCGLPCRGGAAIGETPYCHPNNRAYPDCYHLSTVWGDQ